LKRGGCKGEKTLRKRREKTEEKLKNSVFKTEGKRSGGKTLRGKGGKKSRPSKRNPTEKWGKASGEESQESGH